MDAKSADTRPRLSHRVGALVDSFETVIYAIAFLLLVAGNWWPIAARIAAAFIEHGCDVVAAIDRLWFAAQCCQHHVVGAIAMHRVQKIQQY